MSAFINRQGEDATAVLASIHHTGTKHSSNSVNDVYYRRLPHRMMLQIEEFYKTSEPLIAIVNEIKDFHLLGGIEEMFPTFGGEPLPEREAMHINEAMHNLLPQLRQWRDMFGFVAIVDPNIEQDRALEREEHHHHHTAEQLRGTLERNAGIEIERVAPLVQGDIDALRQRLMAETNATEDGEYFEIHHEPRISATMAPNGFLDIHGKSAAHASEPLASVVELPQRSDEPVRIKEANPRSLMEAMMGISDLEVASLTEGRFFLEVDRMTKRRRVVYARSEHNSECTLFKDNLPGGVGSHLDNGGNVPDLVVAPDVFVYVWPGRMPLDSGRINTKMVEVMRLRNVYAQAEENQMSADSNAANPTSMFEYQMVKNNGDVTRLTDQQLHSGGHDLQDAAQVERLRQEGAHMARMEALYSMARDQRYGEFHERLANGIERPTVRGADGVSQLRTIGPVKQLALPEGFHFAGVLPSTTVCNTPELLHNYHVALSASLGVPLNVIEGGSTFSAGSSSQTGSSGGKVSAGSAELSQTTLTTTVMSDRKSLGTAVGELWDLMYRHLDTQMIENALRDVFLQENSETEVVSRRVAELQRAVESTVAISNRARLVDAIDKNNAYLAALTSRFAHIGRELRRIASLSYRFELHFVKAAHINVEELQLLYENDGISKLEYVNAIRQRAGMPSITDEAELDANRRARMQIGIEQQEAEQNLALKGDEQRMKLAAKYAPKPGEDGGQPPAKKRKTEEASAKRKKPAAKK